MRRSLKIYVKIIVVYQTKKTSFFLPNKDKIGDSCKANFVYEFSCPGCGYSYIGKTERSLETRISEHAYTLTLTKPARSHNIYSTVLTLFT